MKVLESSSSKSKHAKVGSLWAAPGPLARGLLRYPQNLLVCFFQTHSLVCRFPFLHKGLDAHKLNLKTAHQHCGRFEAFMVCDHQPDRRGDKVTTQDTLDKYKDRILDCLSYAAFQLGHNTTLTFQTLARAQDDPEIISAYINKELVGRRRNDKGTIKQALVALSHGLCFCKSMRWFNGTDAEFDALLKKLESQRTTCYKAQTAPKKRKASDEPLKDVDAEVTAFAGTTQADWDSAGDCTYEQVARHCSRLHSAVMFNMVYQRGGRSADLSRASIVYHDGDSVESSMGSARARLGLQSGDTIVLLERELKTQAYIYTKKHYMHLDGVGSLSRETLRLIDSLFFECATWTKDGDALFTPTAHGSEPSKAHVQTAFVDSAKFSDYFVACSTRLLGLSMRPNRARHMLATHLNREGASDELMASQAARAGSSVQNMRTTYNSQNNAEKGGLSNQLSRFQFDSRFDSEKNTFGVATVTGVECYKRDIQIGRLIRPAATSDRQLVALFHPTSPSEPTLQLSNEFLALPKAEFPHLELAIDQVTGLQTWRNKTATSAHAKKLLKDRMLDTADVILESMQSIQMPVAPIVGDMVQVPHLCVYGEVVGCQGGELQVALAENIDHALSTSVVGYFRFGPKPQEATVALTEVAFPLDLKFHGAGKHKGAIECAFEVRKAMAMETV